MQSYAEAEKLWEVCNAFAAYIVKWEKDAQTIRILFSDAVQAGLFSIRADLEGLKVLGVQDKRGFYV